MRITGIQAKVKNATGMLRGPDIGRGALSRECPTCGAKPGNPCYRNTGGRVDGEDSGGGYWIKLKQPHRARRMRRVEA